MANRNVLNHRRLSRFDAGFIIAIIVAAVMVRIMPHLPNFAPVTALAIFGAYRLRRGGALVPLAAMVISDLIIGMHSLVMWTWGSFGLIALLAHWAMRSDYSAHRLVYASLGGSIAFYLITNFGVWAEGALYPRTFEGLVSSYYNGLPFLRGTLLGDLFYTSVVFGAYHAIGVIARQPTVQYTPDARRI